MIYGLNNPKRRHEYDCLLKSLKNDTACPQDSLVTLSPQLLDGTRSEEALENHCYMVSTRGAIL